MSGETRVFVARLAGTPAFDPIGEPVGRVRDVVVLVPLRGAPRVVGLVVEVPGKRRVFMPMTRVTSVAPGQVISTGLINLRRFEQRPMESLVIGQLLDHTVTFTDGSGSATVEDVAITQSRSGDWFVDQLFVRRHTAGKPGASKNPLGIGPLTLKRRGSTLTVPFDAVTGLHSPEPAQRADALLATYQDLRPADLAGVLRDLPAARRLEVAQALNDSRLAEVLEELPEDEQAAIIERLDLGRAADVLEHMEPDDRADLLHEMGGERAAAVMSRMDPDDAREAQQLLAYADNTAGGLMTTNPVILSPDTTVATALAHIRREELAQALAAVVCVTRPPLETPTGRFLGIVHFQKLLREPPTVAIGSIMESGAEFLTPSDKLGTISRRFATYNLLALPVLDEEKRLVGVVSVDDVLDHILPSGWRETEFELTHE